MLTTDAATYIPKLQTAAAKPTAEAKAEAKLKTTAREFEATLLSMLLKEMRETLDGDGLFPGDSGDVQGGLFDMFLSRHLADGGGIGLAASLVKQMAPARGVAPSSAADDKRPRPDRGTSAPRLAG